MARQKAATFGEFASHASAQPLRPSPQLAVTVRMAPEVMPTDPQAGLLDGKSDDEVLDILGPSDADDRRNRNDEGPNSRKAAQAQTLIAIAEAGDLFHTPAGEGYASVPNDGHTETWPMRSRGFTGWLRRAFYMAHGKPPNAQAMTDALEFLEARGQFDGDEYPVFLRVGEHNGRIYVDLVNDDWQAVEVSREGWRVVAEPPVRFRRARGMLAIPHPVGGGSLAELRHFVNVQTDDWPLIPAWLVAAVRPRGPYPALVLQGEQGSAKSTTARLIRALLDPSAAPLRAPPRSEQDLMIAVMNGWVMAFDNVSRLPDWLSDALCRVATGAGLSARQLYTDADEVIFAGQRPVILNGITDIATREDLRDRALLVTCPPLSETARLEEVVMEEAFVAAHPRLLGALFDAVSTALRNLDATVLTAKPRMADFARWVTAAEPELPWQSGAFLATYAGNRQMAVEQSLEFDPIGAAVRQLTEDRAWGGTVGELLDALRRLVDDHVREGREWPQNARALANRLHRVMPALRRVGVLVEFGNRTKKGRAITIRRDPRATVTSIITDTPAFKKGSGDGDAPPEPFVHPIVTSQEPSLLGDDDGDDGDGTTRTSPEPASQRSDGLERRLGRGDAWEPGRGA